MGRFGARIAPSWTRKKPVGFTVGTLGVRAVALGGVRMLVFAAWRIYAMG